MRLINVKTPTRPLIIMLAALALLSGACRTTQPPGIKPDSTIPANTETDSKSVAEKPLLVGMIEHVSLYPVPNKREDLAVSLVVSVRNDGTPTTAQSWSLEVTSPARPPTTVAAVHVSGQVEMPGSNGAKVDLAKEDLVLKTATVPIAKGSRVKGILTFVLAKTSESVLSNNKAGLTVHFKDSQSNQYQTPRTVIGARAARPGL